MQRLVECVPNFSEGRNPEIIEAIAAAIRDTADVKLLNVDSDGDYNRTVYTFVGEPAAVVSAAVAACRVSAERIDMRRHTGNHPRMGAMDVVPFIPLSGVTMEDCVSCARAFGETVAQQLDIPIYLYEQAATRPERRNLAVVRQGEYEGLSAKLADPNWTPDFGPATLNARSGATITGARPFLIAYNVNLATDRLAIAKDIAFTVRESGRLKKDSSGNKVLDEAGQPVREPGLLRCVKGLGVEMPDRGIVQVSMNLTDFTVTGMHTAFEQCRILAEQAGVRATGSEIVGLVPLQAMRESGRFFLGRDGSQAELLAAAVSGLGLSDLYPFDAADKVIELKLKQE
jgi:glutamate formiminotransferase/formiminotetrahydrofolate cyclodeaminase